MVYNWSTTELDNDIEIWQNGYGDTTIGKVYSDTGTYWAELNANTNSELYQVINTVPGTSVLVYIAHRGRDGEDVMQARWIQRMPALRVH